MTLVSLKDYAAQNNISYEAVRQQVKRYETDLTGHIIKDGRQQFLDEEAVAFLDAKRQKSPVAIIQQSKDDRIDELEETNANLLLKVAAQADKIAELAEWKAEKALEIAAADQTRLLLATTQADLEAAKAAQMAAEAARDEFKAEAELKDKEAVEAAEAAQKDRERADRAEADKEAWARYAADMEAWAGLSWWRRRKTEKPVAPDKQTY